jgi:fatty acid desaturase
MNGLSRLKRYFIVMMMITDSDAESHSYIEKYLDPNSHPIIYFFYTMLYLCFVIFLACLLFHYLGTVWWMWMIFTLLVILAVILRLAGK